MSRITKMVGRFALNSEKRFGHGSTRTGTDNNSKTVYSRKGAKALRTSVRVALGRRTKKPKSGLATESHRRTQTKVAVNHRVAENAGKSGFWALRANGLKQ